MQVLSAILSPVAAIIGVLIGGFISSRNVSRSQLDAKKAAITQERQDACVDFLSAISSYRRYLMRSDARMEEVVATDSSKGTVIVEGGIEYDMRIDEALARIIIVARSDAIIDAASDLSSRLNKFIRLRVQLGKGMVPTQIVEDFRDAEREFGTLVRAELDRRHPFGTP